MMADGRLDVKPLISRRIAFDDASQAYDALLEDKSALGLLLLYGTRQPPALVSEVALAPLTEFRPETPVCGFIGAGNYASRILIPAFKQAGAQLHTIVTASGINGVIHGRKSGFAVASTDIDSMLAKPDINAAVIVTRHNTHAGFTAKALAAGKHVYVEKPLALDGAQLSEIRGAYAAATAAGQARHLMVGFNRRFAPQVVKMKQLLSSVREPKSFIMTMNAGFIPPDHWTQDSAVGGGRIIGEACHFIDLMRFLADSRIVSVQARRMGGNHAEDKASIILGFEDGSFGIIHYLANGSSRFPKERIEVFVAGRVLQLDNFRKLTGYSWPGFRKMNLWRQDKGQLACATAFLEAIRKGLPSPIPVEELFEVAQATIDAADLIRSQ
jgi:predicted dehydrogenase